MHVEVDELLAIARLVTLENPGELVAADLAGLRVILIERPADCSGKACSGLIERPYE